MKIVFVGIEGVEDGVRVGVETFRLVGVKREMVRLADTGVAGRPFPSTKQLWSVSNLLFWLSFWVL